MKATIGRGARRVVAGMVFSALVGGCGTTQPAASPAPSASGVSSGVATTAEPTESPAPTSSAAAAACASADLVITAVDSGGGLGTVGGWLRFQNVGSEPCTLTGWPQVVGVTAGGARTTAGHAIALLDSPVLSSTPVVAIAPGESAVASYAGGDNPTGSASSCPPPYHTLQVTAPGTTRPVSVSAYNVWLGQDLPSCVGIEVTPVVAGSLVPSFSTLAP